MKKEYLLQELEELDIVELGRGQIISKEEMNSCPGDYPVYSSSALNNGEFGKYGKFMFDDERITWSIDGGGRLFFRESHKYSVTNVCGWMKVKNKSVLLTKYLYYSLYFQWILKTFDYTYKAHPSVIRKLYKVKLIPIDEQEKIIKKISEIEDIISKNKLLLPNFDNLIKSRFIEMFGDKGYPTLKWNDVFNTTTGKLDSNAMVENGDYPFFTCAKEVFRIDKYAFDQEALLLAGNNAAGKYDVKYYKGKFNAYQRTYVLSLKENWSYQLFRYQLEDKLVYLQQQSLGGLTKYLTLKILGELEFIVPPMDKQNEFASFVEQIDKSKFVYHSKNFLWLIFTLLSSTMAYSNVVSIFACPNRC